MLTRRERIMREATRIAGEHGLSLADISSPCGWKQRPKAKIQARNAMLAHVWENFQPIDLCRLAQMFDSDHTTIAYSIGAHMVAIGNTDHPFAKQCLRRRKRMK